MKSSPFALKITSTPPGDAPEWVREKWVGLTLPIAQEASSPQAFVCTDVLARPQSFLSNLLQSLLARSKYKIGYQVESRAAIEILAEKHPDAAEWWQENAPQLTKRGRYFVFQWGFGHVVTSEIQPQSDSPPGFLRLSTFPRSDDPNSIPGAPTLGFGRTALVTMTLFFAMAIAASIFFHAIEDQTTPKTHIRICNGTGDDIQSLTVGSSTIGFLLKNTMTEYRLTEKAFSYASVSAEISGRKFESNIDEKFGEVPLGSGNFTYVVSYVGQAANRRLEAQVCELSRCSCSEHATEMINVHL